MPTNEDRLWDVAIAEAVTGRQPPDLVAIILARLIEPARATKPHPRWQRITWRALQFAAAAAVLLAIGVATGVITWETSGFTETPREPTSMIAAPGAQWHRDGDVIVLDSGELLLSKGSPEVRCNNSSFAIIDGLALVRAGREPTPEYQATLNAWLETKGVEAEMIRNATKWLQGTALCALMLQGTATLDGQKVEAEKPVAEPVWHRVNNVMDIDKLPKGATHVNADGLSCSHLDFLSETPSVEAIRIAGGTEMREEYFHSLAKLPKLAHLDLRYVKWAKGEPVNYRPLLDFTALVRVAVDPIPKLPGDSGVVDYQGRLNASIETCAALSARGVEIELGELDARLGAVAQVVEKLPQLRGISLRGVSNADMKSVAKLSRLESLAIYNSAVSDVGLAYLARGSRITRLVIEGSSVGLPAFYQLSKIATLRHLTIGGDVTGMPADCLAQLSNLKALEELDLQELHASEEQFYLQASDLTALPVLKVLKIGAHNSLTVLNTLPATKAKRVEIDFGESFGIGSLQAISEEETTRANDGLVETLVFRAERLNPAEEDGYDWPAALFAACPKLSRIEVKHVEDFTPSMVEPLLKRLRELAPKVKVEYVP